MAHLTGFLATASSSAVLLRTGPGRRCCTIGWDRDDDTFELGQWLGHRICWMDLSRAGELLLYYVNRNWWGPANSYYQVISRAPWLKALTFWGSPPKAYATAPHMAMFADSGRAVRIYIRPNPYFEPPPPERDELRIEVTRDAPVQAPDDVPLRYVCMLRDGWTQVAGFEPSPEEAARVADWRSVKGLSAAAFEKRHRGWTLRRTCWQGFGRLRAREVNKNNGVFDSYAVVDPSGAVLDRRAWEWADIDPERDRIVFTQDCVLHAARLGAGELGVATPLFDSRPLRFEEREAPY